MTLALALLASLAWLTAFVAGKVTGHLYLFLGSTAALCIALFLWRDPALRARCKGGVVDVVAGFVVGGVTLLATYGLFPVFTGLVPSLKAEITTLYVLAAVTPATLAGTVVVAVGEEVIWRGALLGALKERYGALSVVLAAIPYALAQLGAGSLWLGAAAFGLGCVWGGLAYGRQSLVAPVIAHLCWTPVVLGWRPLVDLP